jgi:hypothetical protein
VFTSAKNYLRRNWKRLAAANLVSFGLQAALLALLLWCGLAAVPAVAVAKGGSWLSFLGQLWLCRK